MRCSAAVEPVHVHSEVQTLPLERIGEDALLERVTAAAEERQLSKNAKAALLLLYNVLGFVNPFPECLALKFAPGKAELRFHTPHSSKWRYLAI
jgi:hypothetical protein